MFDTCAVNAVSPLDMHWPQCTSSHKSGWEICTCGGNGPNHKKSLFEEQKNHAEINTHSANANLTGVVEWRNAIWLPVRSIFRGNMGLTECFAYITVPADPWGTVWESWKCCSSLILCFSIGLSSKLALGVQTNPADPGGEAGIKAQLP